MNLPWYKYYLALGDFIIILVSFFESRLILILWGKIVSYQTHTNVFGVSYAFLITSLIFSVVLILLFQNFNLYKLHIFLSKSLQISSIIRSLFYLIGLLIVFSFFFKYSYIVDSRSLVGLIFLTALTNFFVFRIGLLRILFIKFSNIKPLIRKTVIIGAGQSGKMMAAKLTYEEIHGLKLAGFIDDDYTEGDPIISGLCNLGGTNELEMIKKKYDIDEVIIAIDNISYLNLLDLIYKCKKYNYNVKLNSRLFDIIPQKFETETYLDIPVVDLTTRLNNQVYLPFKRIFDFLATFIGVTLLIPFFLIIAILIKLSSKGPVLYKQTRIGKNGNPFLFYKFRSMKMNHGEDEERKENMIKFMKSNSSNGSAKVVNEKRVTWIGRFIRKTSIDELPQLINVLKGEMSLVGPRPCLPYEYENYDEWQKRRLQVTPGCTGVWQVVGRSNVTFNDSVVLDLYYINNMSPWFDLQLLFKTIPVMIYGKGGK